MTAQLNKPIKIRKPLKGSKAEAILTLAATTPATPMEIADTVNTSRQLVHQTLKRYGLDPNETKSYKEHRADILAGMQAKLLNNLDDERIKKAPLGTLVLAACQLYDKERLERDLSTSNTASVFADIAELKGLKMAQSGGKQGDQG
jgi:predicted DNA-binding protein YlxM (UPF0122 family)